MCIIVLIAADLVLLHCYWIFLLIVVIASVFTFIAMILVCIAKINWKPSYPNPNLKLPKLPNYLVHVKDLMSQNLPIITIFTSSGKTTVKSFQCFRTVARFTWLSTKNNNYCKLQFCWKATVPSLDEYTIALAKWVQDRRHSSEIKVYISEYTVGLINMNTLKGPIVQP